MSLSHVGSLVSIHKSKRNFILKNICESQGKWKGNSAKPWLFVNFDVWYLIYVRFVLRNRMCCQSWWACGLSLLFALSLYIECELEIVAMLNIGINSITLSKCSMCNRKMLTWKTVQIECNYKSSASSSRITSCTLMLVGCRGGGATEVGGGGAGGMSAMRFNR